MLNQRDIDILKSEIDKYGETTLYYVAHMIEPREGVLDEHEYKSFARFKVLQLTLTDIFNAYFEYMDYMKFLNDPDNSDKKYNVEQEISYYDHLTQHIDMFVVPEYTEESYPLPFNARIPSIVYGYRRQIIDTKTKSIREVSDPTPVSFVYTNNPSYLDKSVDEVKEMIDSGELAWKYIHFGHIEEYQVEVLNGVFETRTRYVREPAISDGVEYDYLTSDWFILNIKNFPRTELPLICTNQKCAYFRDLNDALNYMDQLEA